MAAKVNKVLKSFSGFIKIMNVFGISKFEPLKSNLLEFSSRCYTLFFMLLFIWLWNSKLMSRFFPTFDPLTNYAMNIDLSTVILLTAGLFFDATFRKKQNFLIFDKIHKIDCFLLQHFNSKFKYERIKFLNIFFLILISYPSLLVSRQFFALKLDLFNIFVFSLFVSGLTAFYIVKTVYVSITVQLLIRLKTVELLLESKTEVFIEKRKLHLVELFRMFHDLIDIFNESFGFIILMIFSKSKMVFGWTKFNFCLLIFSQVNAFLRITTRAFVLLVVFSDTEFRFYSFIGLYSFRVFETNVNS